MADLPTLGDAAYAGAHRLVDALLLIFFVNFRRGLLDLLLQSAGVASDGRIRDRIDALRRKMRHPTLGRRRVG